MKIHKLWNDYPDLSKDLQKTLKLMEKSINISNPEVEEAILTMMHSGGKLLRPAYLLLFSQFGKNVNKDKITALAAAMETLHTATLIHDDIVDEAGLRRNQETLQHRFGKDVAVYAGDYLFVSCFKILSNHASTLKSIQLNARSMETILAGELGQMNNRYDTSMSVTTYLKNIGGKTAELFGLSCSVGAYESGCSPLFAKKCQNIGYAIGITFQILDDILDYSQESEQIGKPVLEDVKQGVYSLPLLYALETHKTELLPYLSKKENMTSEDTEKVFEIVHSSGGIDSANTLAEFYTTKALKEISRLPKNEQKTKETLYDLTELLLNRKQ